MAKDKFSNKIAKKKLAVFAGGWSGEYLEEVLAGIINDAEKENFDTFAFVNFSVASASPSINAVQVNFFKIPDLADFDAVILLANSFNQPEELEYLVSEIERTKIPAVVVEHEQEGIPSIITDNYSGMYSLSEHLIKEHGVKDILFVGGPANHSECQIRLKSLLDACKDNSISIPDDNIIYANWGKDIIPELMDGWYLDSKHLPDAIICANDIMAIAVCEWVRDIGFDIPRDTIVTGYDCVTMAQHFDPSITSVNHEWFPMGTQAFSLIQKIMRGEEVPNVVSLPTKLVVGGSCGCSKRSTSFKSKHNLGRALTRNIMDPILVDSHFRHFSSAAKDVSSRDEFYGSFSYLFEHANIIEGKSFGLYLYSDIFAQGKQFDDSLVDYGLLERIVSLKEGRVSAVKNVTIKEVIFDLANDEDKPGYYIFIPLHSSHRTYGLAVLTGPLNAASENQYYIWSMHMIQALEQVEANITIAKLYKEMERLSVTDPLTGVYNRAGCESISYPKMIERGNSGKQSIIMLADVDRMKFINDRYGHSNGDIALKVITEALSEALPDGFLISRFGGDEFFVSGEYTPDMNVEELIIDIDSKVDEKSRKRNVSFPLSASIGYAIITPTEVADIEHAIVHADVDMYKRKEIHHLTSMI